MYKLSSIYFILPLAFFLLGGPKTVFAQHEEHNPYQPSTPIDSLNEYHRIHPHTERKFTSLTDYFKAGHIHGRVREYTMSTINYDDYTDHFAVALGAELSYLTPEYKGFQFGMAGLFTFNVFSTDLHNADLLSQKLPSFERQLFDITDPYNKKDLDRLDELFVKYNFFKKSFFLVGRFTNYSPLINPQDGRMKPYANQGYYLEINELKPVQLSLGWYDHFSPRSTVEFFHAGESIGIYSQGYTVDGEKSEYHEHTETAGVSIIGLKNRTSFFDKAHEKIEVWHYWTQNISHTIFSETEWTIDINHHKNKLILGAQYLYQTQSGNGGNENPLLAYFPDQQVHLFSGEVGAKIGSNKIIASALHITKDGRLTFPQEWGREQFFSTLARGRVEGLGNSTLALIRYVKEFNQKFSSDLGLSRLWSPGVEEYQWNKYMIPSYYQFNVDLNYKFGKTLNGLSTRLLYIWKHSIEDEFHPMSYYKANYHHFNLIVNYHI